MLDEFLNKIKKPAFLNFFAFYVFTVVIGYVFFVTFGKIPDQNVRFADTALGFLLAQGLNLILVWAFRTSKSAMDEKAVKLQSELTSTPAPEDPTRVCPLDEEKPQ